MHRLFDEEYAAAIQYVQHAAVITGPEYESVLKEVVHNIYLDALVVAQ
jgi:hypothetical protein